MTTEERVAGIETYGREHGWSEAHIARLVECQRHCDAQPIVPRTVHFVIGPDGRPSYVGST